VLGGSNLKHPKDFKSLQEVMRKYVDTWEPSEKDIKWLQQTVEKMAIGGLWNIPAAGVTFEKADSNHLRLKSIGTDDPLDAMITIGKTEKVGKRAGIKVDIEAATELIIFKL